MENKKAQPADTTHTLDHLVAMTAHDLNNLLTTILGSTELTALGLPVQHPSQKHLHTSRLAIQHAAKLLQHLRMKDDPHSFQPVALDAIIDDAITLLRVTLPPSITIHYIPPLNPGSILGDAVLIHQVISNILLNAVQAMSGLPCGIIMIECTTVEEHNLENRQAAVRPYLRLSISDSGPGIEADIHDRIFDPYFTRSYDHRRTGLGLTIASQIMKKHGGFIAVHSAIGVGSTFHVYFPTENC